MDERSLIICGDIHRKLKELVQKLEKFDISKASLVVCGDFGAGFGGKETMDKLYEECKSSLEEHEITIYAIRGNHDDPKFFKDPEKYDYPRLEFLKDHSLYEIEGRTIYTIGGANSIDYEWRQEWNKEKGDEENKVWWEDEDIVRVPVEKIPTKTVDILVTHEAPLVFSPIPTRLDGCSTEVYEKILSSRTYLNSVLKEMNVKYWFYGHYHTSYSGSYNSVIWRCLDELELFQLPDKEPEKIKEEKEKC